MIARPCVVSWSGGKDSAFALHQVLQAAEYEPVGLITTITSDYDRISIHGVRTTLLRTQCRSLQMDVVEVKIPAQCSNAVYEEALKRDLLALRDGGVHDVVFGDLFLADVRAYRERVLEDVGMTAHFPLWGHDTRVLAQSLVVNGWRAKIVCVDTQQIHPDFCGREFDANLLSELPASCDPCGERGEFHTFVYDGPIFQEPVVFTTGETVQRGELAFCDLID